MFGLRMFGYGQAGPTLGSAIARRLVLVGSWWRWVAAGGTMLLGHVVANC